MSTAPQLPLISKKFFDEHPPAMTLFLKWKDEYSWSEKIMPIYEWDEVLYVACEEAPIDWSSKTKVIFLKADRLCLAQTWLAYRLNPAPTISKTVESGDPFASLLSETPVAQAKSDSLALVDTPEESTLALSEEPIEELELLSEEEKKQDPAKPAVELAVSHDSFDSILEKMKAHFKKSMILKKEGNAVKAWKWDQSFSEANSNNVFTLGVPSPFRIVSRTLKPYHGYLPKNEITTQFFSTFNKGVIPDHITLTPIVIEDELIGMLLGIGDKEINQKSSLVLADNCSQELAQAIKTTAANPSAA